MSSTGKALIHHYRTRVVDDYALHAECPTGSKLTRAQPVAANAELFPDGAHDDQIYCAGIAHP